MATRSLSASPHPLFDPDWYQRENPDLQPDQVSFGHYLSEGWRHGRSPHPLFDVRHYVGIHPNLRQSGQEPLTYFVAGGWRDGVSPHPAIDLAYYLAQMPPLGGLDPLTFHIREGWKKGFRLSPSHLFEVISGQTVEDGPPSLQFRILPKSVDDETKQVAVSHAGGPLAILGEESGNSVNLAFDPDWYLEEYPDVARAGLRAIDHYNRFGRDEGRHPSFDAEWYCAEYPDVKLAGVDPYEHYRSRGRREGRHPAFSAIWYLRTNPDVRNAGLDPYKHYVNLGRSEGRSPSGSGRPVRRYTPRTEGFPTPYSSEYQIKQDFSGKATDIKLVAFYLPQFHECPQNNEWWGNGFTEWTNTQKALPRFDGHYQPREPHEDIGYYDLSVVNDIRGQARLARQFGLYGFAIYHYWFSGERLLETPLDLIIQNKNIDINFCLCWANENWTRTWDGLQNNILVEQRYLDNDPEKFILDCEQYLLDPRYMRINGSPVIIVYKPHLIPLIDDVFNTWRKVWKDRHGEDLLIWVNRTNFYDTAVKRSGTRIDGVVEFPPHVVPYEFDQASLGLETNGRFYDYQQLVDDIVTENEITDNPTDNFYRCAMLGWDNSARREEGWSLWYGFSQKKYYEWLRYLIESARKTHAVDHRFVFVNAWNEWAEGTYLEPDRKFGYANLNITARALYGLPFDEEAVAPAVGRADQSGLKVAIHLHIFHAELARELLDACLATPGTFDLFISTDTEAKRDKIAGALRAMKFAGHSEIVVSANRGRDIGPMLLEFRSSLLKYDVVGHFHSKRSLTVDWGDRWRNYLLTNLLPESGGIRAIFKMFQDDPRLGIVFPPPYPLIAPYVDWGGVEERCRAILHSMGCRRGLPRIPTFPVGNMFWARVDAIKPMLEYSWRVQDFEPEADQVADTLPHCIERIWALVAANAGYASKQIIAKNLRRRSVNGGHVNAKRLAIFVHFSHDGVSDADIFLLRKIRKLCDDVVLVSNSPISDTDRRKINPICGSIIVRDNRGFDFAAWRDGIRSIKPDILGLYDELILINNSCYGPVYPLEEAFECMAEAGVDFWGMSEFPETHASKRAEAALLERNHIPWHLQSYFMVFRRQVFLSKAFQDFWGDVSELNDILEVIANYEVRLTGVLKRSGFKGASYAPESRIMQERQIGDVKYNAAYSDPYALALLRMPFVKKKSKIYAPQQLQRVSELISAAGHFPVELLKW